MKKDGYMIKRDSYHLAEFDPVMSTGKYQIPTLFSEKYVPSKLIDFNEAIHSKKFDCGVHFYLDDYRFERIWKEPHRYIKILKRFSCVFTPDFSLYTDMPLTMKIWNTYRSRMIGQMMQHAGIHVIPTISWAGPDTYEFCFSGVEAKSVVTVSTVGVMRKKETKELFLSGLNAMIKTLRPSTIIMYGRIPQNLPADCKFINFENTSLLWKTRNVDVNCKEIA